MPTTTVGSTPARPARPTSRCVLDGRFSVQTDANGRFSFPVVAAGHHVITVISDNLPLPWALLNGGSTEVDVTTRGRTDISIGAQRPALMGAEILRAHVRDIA